MLIDLISSLLMLSVGIGAGYQVANLGTMQTISEKKAITKYFNCSKNDFTYFYENIDDFYIVSLKSTEYRVKFSLGRPIQIVYSVEVEKSNETN